MDQEDWKNKLTGIGALWVHDQNQKCPHALLTSGLHSNGFVNMTLLTQDPVLLADACGDLIDLSMDLPDYDWCIGSAMGSVTLASRFAEGCLEDCKAGFTEKEAKKDDETGKEIEVMKLKRFEIPPGARVLTFEDVLTTGGTVIKTIAECKAKGLIVIPTIICLVNRSGKQEIGGNSIISLVDIPLQNWKAEECPLCSVGSEAIRPKAEGNWARLTAEYQ